MGDYGYNHTSKGYFTLFVAGFGAHLLKAPGTNFQTFQAAPTGAGW